ncbi:hypothetical protein ACWEFJ_21750 [Actinosynnema sp. NPDC004786]
MSTSMASSRRTTAAIQARRSNTEMMLERVRDALRHIRRERARVTIAAVARRAEVSRTFLYQNVEARALIAAGTAAASDQRSRDEAGQAAHIEATWRQRALNAEAALKDAHTEISLQRNNIGQLLGKIRDLEHDLPVDSVQRLLTENSTLKREIRKITQDSQRLAERLQGARDNNRFLDKRVAELEAELADRLSIGKPRR